MADVKDAAEEIEEQEPERRPEDETPAEADAAPADGEAGHDAPAEEMEAPPDPPPGLNLMQALIEAQKEAQSNEDGWQRARAEFANYKKRIERERSELFQRASLDTLKALLPIIDDFDRAFENVPEDIGEHAWIGGVAMIQRKFQTLLEQYEICPIDPAGELFDPNLHQAIGMEDSDEVESGCVTATLQKGYRAGDQILRLALVKVAS